LPFLDGNRHFLDSNPNFGAGKAFFSLAFSIPVEKCRIPAQNSESPDGKSKFPISFLDFGTGKGGFSLAFRISKSDHY